MRLLITTIVLAALNSCSSFTTTQAGVSPNQPGSSIWGNENETLTITSDGARFEGICVEGTVSEPIVLKDGVFESVGTLRRKGGARLDDSSPKIVHFIGNIAGDQMTLRIVGEEKVTVEETTLRNGRRGTARPCP